MTILRLSHWFSDGGLTYRGHINVKPLSALSVFLQLYKEQTLNTCNIVHSNMCVTT